MENLAKSAPEKGTPWLAWLTPLQKVSFYFDFHTCEVHDFFKFIFAFNFVNLRNITRQDF